MADLPQSSDEVRAFFSEWTGRADAGEWDRFAELLDPDVVLHDPMVAEPAVGLDAVVARVQAQYEPFPDGRMEVIGDPFVALDIPELAYRWQFTGTHQRRIDPPGFAPTGETVQVDGMSVLRLREGRAVEVVLVFDTTAVARQVLAAPPAGSPLERVVAATQRLRVRFRR